MVAAIGMAHAPAAAAGFLSPGQGRLGRGLVVGKQCHPDAPGLSSVRRDRAGPVGAAPLPITGRVSRSEWRG